MGADKVSGTSVSAISKIAGTAIGDISSIMGEDVSSFSNTYSLNFDGVDDYVATTATYSPLDGLATMSLSVWIKPVTGDSYYMVAHNPINTTIQQSQFMLFWGPGSLLEFSITSRSLFLRGDPASITIDAWNHILCCVDFNASPEGKIYVDGVDVTTGDNMSSLSTIPTATGVMRLGKEAQGYLSPFLGNIDEFAIWNTDQRANVASIYSASGAVNLSTLAAPPITWWRNGDKVTSFPTIPDQIGSVDGTATNMVVGDIEEDVPT